MTCTRVAGSGLSAGKSLGQRISGTSDRVLACFRNMLREVPRTLGGAF